MAIADHSERSLTDLLSFDGRCVVITGGARGLGLQMGRRFAEAGATVVLADLDADGAAAAAEDLPGTAEGVALDVTDVEATVRLADDVVERHGHLDVWVNNAGIFPFSDAVEMSDEEWRRVIDINLTGTFWGAREAGRRMAADRGGVIINLASTAGYSATGPGIAHYVATKHAVRGLTKSLAVELGPKGVRSVALAPALIATPGTEALRRGGLEAGGSDMFEDVAAQIPLGRVGVPDDVARIAVALASDLAAFVSGDTLLVDGGITAL
jgi:NAD(P)-dependent dehydrogenase (short-subunit alcohol dehydrogenase family)